MADLVKPTVKRSKVVYHSPWITVYEDDLEIRGAQILYNWFDRSDGVSVVAVTDKDEVVLLKEYRHGVKDYIWSIPCGRIEENEKRFEAAKRELREESGYSGARFDFVGEFVALPAASGNMGYSILARELTLEDTAREAYESMQVELVPFTKALELVWANEIKDAWVIIPLLQAARFLGRL